MGLMKFFIRKGVPGGLVRVVAKNFKEIDSLCGI
jgi:hypothetical protein